jgi:hypothetical protein
MMEALTVNTVQWGFKKIQGLGAPGKNNTMVGIQTLILLDSFP